MLGGVGAAATVLAPLPGAGGGQPRQPGQGVGPGPLTGLITPRGLPELPNGGVCAQCGGTYDADGWCEQCGAKAPDPRHHYEIDGASWAGGVCDRGIRHPGNEDALALAAEETPAQEGAARRAALVVCDGVTTAAYSDVASLAAAQSALDVLTLSQARGMGVAAALVGALGARLDAATDAANAAVVQVARAMRGTSAGQPGQSDQPDRPGQPGYEDDDHVGSACTFVAAAIEGDLAVIGSVGDSRAYWLPDASEPRLLTTDDSWAEAQIKAGVSREEAESGPQAHTITRWLGPEAPDHTPAKVTLEADRPGWLLLCSDGLWNYASEPTDLAQVLADARAQVGDEPVPLASALVDWANAQGGRDNVTVALARLGATSAESNETASQTAAEAPSQTAAEPGVAPEVATQTAVEPGAAGPPTAIAVPSTREG